MGKSYKLSNIQLSVRGHIIEWTNDAHFKVKHCKKCMSEKMQKCMGIHTLIYIIMCACLNKSLGKDFLLCIFGMSSERGELRQIHI